MERRDAARKTGFDAAAPLATKLLSDCGMIPGVGFYDSAKAGFPSRILAGAGSNLHQRSCVLGCAAAAEFDQRISACLIHPVSKRERINQVFGSDSLGLCATVAVQQCAAAVDGEFDRDDRLWRTELVEPFRRVLRLNVIAS